MPQKRKGFTLIELLIVVVIVGILALAAIPLITSNTRDARRAEGTQLMQSARDWCRTTYAKKGTFDAEAVAAFGVEHATNQWKGNYYSVDNTPPTDAAPKILSTAVNKGDKNGTLTFNWGSGESDIVWN